MKKRLNEKLSTRTWRNKRTGTVYASVSFNGTGVAEVTVPGGSTFLVNEDAIEQVSDMQPSDSKPRKGTAKASTTPTNGESKK